MAFDSNNIRVLLVANVIVLEDEPDLCEEVVDFLCGLGYSVRAAGSLQQFIALCAEKKPDIAIMDRSLPDGDAMSVIQDLRSRGERFGVIMFTARGSAQDRLEGMQSGADHYLAKPVRMQELQAVVSALAWRMQLVAQWHLRWSTWELHSTSGAMVKLTPQEAMFLRLLIDCRGQVASRRRIVEALGKNFLAYDLRNLDALVLRLRKKVLEVTAVPLPVKTVHGTGYQMSSEVVLSDA